jgi:hypothetical protein
MNDFAYDGTPLQTGPQEQSLTGNFPQFSILGLREMVVIGRRYKKDDFNRSRTQVEYTVRDLRTGDSFPGARRIDIMSGAEDGDDNVLHPAGKARKNSSGEVGPQTPSANTDGDRVLVGFLEGSRSQPVIIGVFRHPDATYGSTADDGERRYSTHKGTSMEVTSSGAFKLVHKSGTSITIDDDGNVTVNVKSGKVMTVDDGSGAKELAYKSDVVAVDNKYEGHFHIAPNGQTSGPVKTTVPAPANPNVGLDPAHPFLDSGGNPSMSPVLPGPGLDAAEIVGTSVLKGK